MSSSLGNKKKNLEKINSLANRARKKGADIVIFPELCLTGYNIRDRSYELAETIPGPSVEIIEKISKETNTHIIFGMPEVSNKAKATLFNTAVIVSPSGYLGKYRKMYLPTHSVFEEKRYFRPGYQANVFNTEFGKIGLSICYDIYFPEIYRLLRLKGAEILVCISASPSIRKNYFKILSTARALENTAFLAYVNLAGLDKNIQFSGGSRFVSPSGDIIAEAKDYEDELIVCEFDVNDIKPLEAFIPVWKDLRPELFQQLIQLSEEL